MDALTILIGGMLLGLAGSLHCATMCGCIASGALFVLDPPGTAARVRTLAVMQAGRIACYILLGALGGAAIAQVVNPSATIAQFQIMQWAAAAVVMWVGLSMAGVLPRVEFASRLVAVSAGTISRWTRTAAGPASATPLALGLVWGATPCPMVYAALFSAALTGSFSGGAIWMAGFGLGTVPAVTAAALGATGLRRMSVNPYAQRLGGIVIAAFGLLSVTHALPSMALFCATR